MKRFIGRCKAKGCKFTVAVDIDMTPYTSVQPYRVLTLGGFADMGTRKVIQWESAQLQASRELPRCSAHPAAWMEINPLKGRLVETVPCDARCTNAIGHTCDCSCGGANHASKRLITELVTR